MYRGSFPGINRLVLDTNHSRPSSAEFKNEKRDAFISTIRLHGFDGDNLTWLCYIEEGFAEALRVGRASPDIGGTHLEFYCSLQTANWPLDLGPQLSNVASFRVLLRSSITLSADAT